ncbi:uncharacterized protein [Rutidosis leptorrhynchoides]|uniref:uncharacterized protein n=1 Tax=Rutidosis leptorrhynchoides TaxID=125765 RepID=UPI003A993427
MADKFHPALSISNIKNLIPITLDIKDAQYNSWAQLFKIHCKTYDVPDHIIPPSPSPGSSSTIMTDTTIDALWHRLDAVVLQWIYGTISTDLLSNILEDESTAANAWTPYCQEIKVIADQLRNVGDKVSDSRMVLQLIAGLNDNFNTVGTYFTQLTDLPSFYEARSKLLLEETRKKKQASFNSNNNEAALLSTAISNPAVTNHSPLPTDRNRYPNNNQTYRYPPWFYSQPLWASSSQWAAPPCPYPTSAWAHPNTSNNSNQAGILGPRPTQANYSTSSISSGYCPIDIDSAWHTMTLNPPDDTWYMDTGATSHMTANSGNLESYYPLMQRKNIIVGNGHGIPIHGFGHSKLSNPSRPLYLQNILHSPNLIKNLISVRRLSTDNNISLEFDPFGFTVKDFPQGTTVLRCNSTSDLYPIINTMLQHLTKPSTFAALSPNIWHHRLGHPGDEIIRSLSNKKFISCNKQFLNSICQSCVFGKQIKLPFISSLSTTLSPLI